MQTGASKNKKRKKWGASHCKSRRRRKSSETDDFPKEVSDGCVKVPVDL